MRITLTEAALIDNGFQATLAFEESNRRYPVTVAPPCDEQQEAELEWYFEQHLKFPFINNVRYQNAAESVRTCGETLFGQVFSADPDAYGDYRDALRDGFELEILGSPAFHGLHWETLKDPKQPEPLALHQVIVRKPLNLNARFQPITPRESPVLNILLAVARPEGRKDVGYRTISRPLVEMVRDASLPVNIEILRPGTYKALKQPLNQLSATCG
ncbi:MAG: hypothetical protein GY862_08725, partial [Gammaproteobacteria bacterium]|nr:hypothetical protein [Gammaproteobacteria bacterium]